MPGRGRGRCGGRRRRHRKRGGLAFDRKKIMSWLGKANKLLKKHKILSRGAKLYSSYGGLPYSDQIGMAGKIAEKYGYGRRRRLTRVGYGVSPAGGMSGYRRGGGIRLPGRRPCYIRYRR